jgi:hypothetical protein
MSNNEILTKAIDFLALNRNMGDLKIDNNTVVHCKTEELAKQVLKIAYKLGYKWSNGASFLYEHKWNLFKDLSHYFLHEGFVAKRDFFGINYKIISAQEFIDLHKTEETLLSKLQKIQEEYSDVQHKPYSVIENQGQKFDEGYKESNGKRYYELDWNFINQMADRMSQNKKPVGKYERWNWKKPIDIEGLKQATMRHLIEVIKGNYEDEGRPYGHLEAIADNCMMINYQLNNNDKTKC